LERQQAKELWTFWHEFSRVHCMHGEKCAAKARDGACTHGIRFEQLSLVTGAVLPVWHCIEKIISRNHVGNRAYGRVVRCTTTADETHVIGMEVASSMEEALVEACQPQREADDNRDDAS
jgi:hypothetical protein